MPLQKSECGRPGFPQQRIPPGLCRCRGQRVEANGGAPNYDPTLAHIPLAIYVTLTPGEEVVDDFDGSVGEAFFATICACTATASICQACCRSKHI
jgi:hypothetical protein